MILRLPEVVSATGLSRSTIFRLVKANNFPQPVTLTPRTIGWMDSEIQDWVLDRADARPTAEEGQADA